MDDPIVISARVSIHPAELRFRTSRSGGPGGQHVNTSSTRVELLFDVARSPSLTDSQRQRVMEALRTRIDSEGVLRLVSQTKRSQAANREEAVRRFRALLAMAMRPRKTRVATAPSTASRARRRNQKRRRAALKKVRRRPGDEGD